MEEHRSRMGCHDFRNLIWRFVYFSQNVQFIFAEMHQTALDFDNSWLCFSRVEARLEQTRHNPTKRVRACVQKHACKHVVATW